MQTVVIQLFDPNLDSLFSLQYTKTHLITQESSQQYWTRVSSREFDVLDCYIMSSFFTQNKDHYLIFKKIEHNIVLTYLRNIANPLVLD
jgi:hypothetical protein